MSLKKVPPVQQEPALKKYQPPIEILAEHKEFIKKVGEKLQKIRKNKNMSPSKLSTESGVSRTLIYKIEGGNAYFTISTLLQVLDALKISATDFFKDL